MKYFLLMIILFSSCSKHKLSNHALDVLDLKRIYNNIEDFISKNSEPPTAKELLKITNDLEMTKMKRSPQYKNFVGFLYYYDGAFDKNSDKPILYSRLKSKSGVYNTILMNGTRVSVKTIPKEGNKIFLLKRNKKPES